MTSFYLDVDGARYPRPSDYAAHVGELTRRARELAARQGQEVAAGVEADLARIGTRLEQGLDRRATRGVAAFCCQAQGLFVAWELRSSVRDQVAVGPGADIAQLCELLATAEHTLVVGVDQQRSRLLRLELGAIEEHDAPTNGKERQVDTDVELGSFERRHEEQVRQHHRHVAEAVTKELDHQPTRYVVLSGPQPSVSSLERQLPSRAASLVAGSVSLPVGTEQGELANAARRVVASVQGRQRNTMIQELRDQAGQGVGAVAGLAGTLLALGAGQVRTAVVERGFAASGGRCPECQQLATGSRCPRCGAATAALDNVVDAAVGDAFLGHVPLEFCEPGDLAGMGQIGAFVR